MIEIVASVLIAIVAVTTAQSFDKDVEKTFEAWLKDPDPTLSKSAALANLVADIHNLAVDVPNLTLFLPRNEAWSVETALHDAFQDSADLRYDMVLAASAEILDDQETPLDSLRVHQETYGMLDSTYGTPFFLVEKASGREVCMGHWDDDVYDYVPTDSCTELIRSFRLKDATVFEVDRVVLPTYLLEDVHAFLDEK